MKEALETLIMELKVAMVLAGASDLEGLGDITVVGEGRIKNWM